MGSTYNMAGDPVAPRMKLKGFLTVFGGLLIHLALGGEYTFGNVMPYLISYLKYRAGDHNVRTVDSLWFTTASSPLTVLSFMFSGILYRKCGPRITTAIGALIHCVSTFLIYFAVQKSFIALAFMQSVLSVLGTTFAYGASLAAAIQWFPQRSGLAGGIIMAGFGGSSSILNQIITFYINPDNLSPDVKEGSERYFSNEDLLNRVPKCYLLLGGIYSVLEIFGVLLLFSPPSSDNTKVAVAYNKKSNTNFDENEKAENKDGDAAVDDGNIKNSHIEMKQSNYSTEGVKEENANKEKASTEIHAHADLTVLQLIKQMVKSRNFYIFSVILFSVGYGNVTITTLYKAYGQTFIFDDHFLALVGSFSSIFNCVGRPSWGAFMDRFRFKVAILCITAGSASLMLTVIASEWVGKTFFAVWICAFYFCVCGTYSTVPAILSKLYGVSNFSIAYGLIRIATIATSVMSAVMGTKFQAVIGWHGVYLLGGGVTALGFVASLFFKEEDSEQKEKSREVVSEQKEKA